MKNKKLVISISIIGIVFLALIGLVVYRRYQEVRIVFCEILEDDENEITLMQSSGVDPNEYDSIYLYITIPKSEREDFLTIAESNDVNINNEFVLTFSYNELTGFKRKEGKIYFTASEILNVQDSLTTSGKEKKDE